MDFVLLKITCDSAIDDIALGVIDLFSNLCANFNKDGRDYLGMVCIFNCLGLTTN